MPQLHRWSIALAAATVLAMAPATATAAPAGRAPVTQAHATAASASVRLTWHNPGGRNFAATVVRYARGDRAPRKPTAGLRGGRVRAAGHALTIRHLRPATHYSFALFAYYGSGHYARRVVLRAVTAPDAVRLVQPFAHPSYVAITWRAPRASTYATTVVRYAAGRRAPSSPTAGTGVHLAGAKATEARLTHLARRTTYSVSVWTRDRRHQYSPVATTRFTTLGTVTTATGTASGTVTDSSAHPLAGVSVELSDWAHDRAFATTTGADGRYTLAAPAGEYLLVFYGADATGGTNDATGYLAEPRAVTIRARTTRTEDAALAAGAAISGTVTDAAGHPLRGVGVYPRWPEAYVEADGFLIDFGNNVLGVPTTAADGTFTLRGLPSQALQTCYDTSAAVSGGSADARGYTGRCEHVAVAVPAGTIRTLPPVALVQAAGGTVAGTVLDSAGHPVDGAIVQLRGHDGPGFGMAISDARGHYHAGSLPAGRYDVCVDPVTVRISSAATGDAMTCRFAVADVRPGGTVVVNVRLLGGGAAAGRLTGPGGHPLAGARVYLRAAGSDNGGAAVTDAGGQYEVKNLAPGRYIACFDPTGATVAGSPAGARADCYRGGELVEVRRGVVRLGLDASLAAGGAVSGAVVEGDAAHTPAAGAEVYAERSDERDGGSFASATADAQGHYTITGLAAGRYDICAIRSDVAGDAGPACRSNVRVTAGRTARADLAFPPTATLTVTVQDEAGHPVSGVDAVAVSSCGPDSSCGVLPLFAPSKDVATVGTTMTDGDGRAVLAGLPPTPGTRANYAVCVFTYYGATTAGDPSTGYLDDCSTFGTFGFRLTGGSSRSVTFTLHPAGAVGGRVTDANGHPLAGVRVRVSGSSSTDYTDPDFAGLDPSGPQADVTTDADGRYVVPGVRPGARTVCFDASDAVDATGAATPGGFLDQCLGGRPAGVDDGTPVTVPAGSTLDAGVFRLTAGAAIAGRVVAATSGGGLPGTQVIVFDDLGEAVAVARTDHAGGYLIGRLVADNDAVCFWAEGYRPQCYDGVAWSGGSVPAAATRVVAVAGTTRTLKPARLRRG